MASSLSPTRLFTCTACGATLPVGEEQIGKKCRCGRCGWVSVITAEAPVQPNVAAEEQIAADRIRIPFFCRVCDTRMVALGKHIGRKAKCPDCGAITRVPPPPPTPRDRTPQAMHGQQYGLWGVENAPTPAELAARQPKFFPVWCRVCDTLMHARPEQVGKKLQCPDCGAKTTIVAPPPPKPKKSALVPDGQEYQIDKTQAPPPRPQQQFFSPVREQETVEMKEEEAIRHERRDRPKMPALPTLRHLSPMLLRSPVPIWGLWITACLTISALLIVIAQTVSLLAAVICVPPIMCCAALGFGSAAAIYLAVLTESSEGNDRLYNPPSVMFLDWMGDIFYLIAPAMLAMAPWWLLCRVLEQELTFVQQGVIQAVGWLFTFPLLLLSSLENGSPLEPFSPKIFGSVLRRPGHWLLLVLQSLVIAGGALLFFAKLLTIEPWLGLLIVPTLVVGGFLYFRILGRFAWWLAESLASDDLDSVSDADSD